MSGGRRERDKECRMNEHRTAGLVSSCAKNKSDVNTRNRCYAVPCSFSKYEHARLVQRTLQPQKILLCSILFRLVSRKSREPHHPHVSRRRMMMMILVLLLHITVGICRTRSFSLQLTVRTYRTTIFAGCRRTIGLKRRHYVLTWFLATTT